MVMVVDDRENWAGHVCLGRDRVTITFQLIKNKRHLQNATDSNSTATSMQYARVSSLLARRHFHSSRAVVYVVSGVNAARHSTALGVASTARGGAADVRLTDAAIGAILPSRHRHYRPVPSAKHRSATAAAAAVAALAARAERTIRNSEYLRNLTP